MRKTAYFWLFVFGCFAKIQAQTPDEQAFEAAIKLPHTATKAQTALQIGRSWEGKPYAAHTLEQTPEALVCNLQAFDCYTFIESVVALTLTATRIKPQFADYQYFLQKLRYRNGRINGYESRLHYFLEWIQQAKQNGYLRDVTRELGGKPIQKNIDFMTKHQLLYPAMTTAKTTQTMAEVEQKLSNTIWYYIPKNEAKSCESKLQDGDIVAFTSGKAGLDFNHEGLVVIKKGRAYLLHASTNHRRVLLTTEPLLVYLAQIKHHNGMVVLRFD
jgi:hypothetical protein